LLREIFLFADAFDMYLFLFTELSTVFTLGYRAAFLFYFKERTICVFAC
jgi:hypothetical protein